MDIKTAHSIMHPFSHTTTKPDIEWIARLVKSWAEANGYDVELGECHDNEDNISMGIYMPDEVVLCYYKTTGDITFENREFGHVIVTDQAINDLVAFYKPAYSYQDAIDEQADRALS